MCSERRTHWIVIAVLVATASHAAAQEREAVPPLSPGRVAGEVVVGGLVGVGGLAVAGYAGYLMTKDDPNCPDLCGFGGAIMGGVVGITAFAPVGVYIVDSRGDQTGSLLATFGGSIGGVLLGFGVALIEDDAALIAIPIGAVAGSVIGFNLTRRYKRRELVSWLPAVNASSERVELALVGRF